MRRATPKRILIVDDDDKRRRMLCTQLRNAGFDCTPAGDMSSAMELVFRHRPDLVIVEATADGAEGLELISRIRRECVPTAPPIIALSAFIDFRGQALTRGASLFLLRPVHSDDLRIAMDTLLATRARPEFATDEAEDHARSARTRTQQAAAGVMGWLRERVPDLERRALYACEWMRRYLGMVEVFAVLNDVDGPRVLGPALSSSLALRSETAWRRMAHDVMETESTIALPDLGRWIRFESEADRIGVFVGVPIFGPMQVPIGALCAFDSEVRRVDPDDVALLELMARRGSGLLSGLPGQVSARWFDPAGLLVRDSFEVVLRGELRRLERTPHALEVGVLSVGAGAPLNELADVIQRSIPPPRSAVAHFGGNQLALLVVRDTEREAATEIAAAVDRVRSSLDGAGIVSVDSGGLPMPDEAQLLRIAERLAARRALRTSGNVERLLFRPEPFRPLAATLEAETDRRG